MIILLTFLVLCGMVHILCMGAMAYALYLDIKGSNFPMNDPRNCLICFLVVLGGGIVPVYFYLLDARDSK